jgi:hypothetical protein
MDVHSRLATKRMCPQRSLDPLTCDSLLLQEEELLLLLWLACRPTAAVPDRLPFAAAVPGGAPGSSRPGTTAPSAPLFQSCVRHSRLNNCSTKYGSSLLFQVGSGSRLCHRDEKFNFTSFLRPLL